MKNKLSGRKLMLLTLMWCALGLLQAKGQEKNDILGEWFTEGQKAKVEFYENKGHYYAKLKWLERGNDKDPILDKNNSDKTLRDRALAGINLIQSLDFNDGIWTDGEIYDPESGRTYSCLVKMKDEETLEIRGYLGMPAFGKSVFWKQAK